MHAPPDRTATRLARLLVAGGLVSAIWLWLLPTIANLPDERRQWRWLERHQIDPSAMFYTELEAMQPILQRLNQRQRQGSPPQARTWPAPAGQDGEPLFPL